MKRLPKVKQLEERIDSDTDEYNEYIEPGIESDDISDHINEFREGIDEIRDMFLSTNGDTGEKFAKLSFGLANLCSYRNTVFEGLLSTGMTESDADSTLDSIIVRAGFNDMMMGVVSFREPAKKKRGRKNGNRPKKNVARSKR